MDTRTPSPESPPTGAPPSGDLSLPQLMTRLSEQTGELVRAEVALARAELQRSVRHAGLGIGLLGTSGVLALYAGGVLVAAAVLALALVIPAWAAALAVGGALLLAVALAGVAGTKQVQQAPPPLRDSADSVREDLRTVQEARHG
jgi:hypothetical protein